MTAALRFGERQLRGETCLAGMLVATPRIVSPCLLDKGGPGIRIDQSLRHADRA